METTDSLKRQEIIQVMRRIEPNYCYWTDYEINEQIDAIYECGYEWIENKGFLHKVGKVYLLIPNLHTYSSSMIHETYQNVWSKDFDRVLATKYLKKLFRTFFYLIIMVIIYPFFFRIEVTYLVIIMSLPFFTYYYYKYYFYLKKHKLQNRLD